MGVEKSLLAKDEEAVPRGATRREGGGNRDKEKKGRKRTILEGKREKGRRLVGGGAKRGGKIKMAIKTPLSSSRKTHNGASNPLPPPVFRFAGGGGDERGKKLLLKLTTLPLTPLRKDDMEGRSAKIKC